MALSQQLSGTLQLRTQLCGSFQLQTLRLAQFFSMLSSQSVALRLHLHLRSHERAELSVSSPKRLLTATRDEFRLRTQLGLPNLARLRAKGHEKGA